jgi:hypothetical protein
MVGWDLSLLRDISEPVAPSESVDWLRVAWFAGASLVVTGVVLALRRWSRDLIGALRRWIDPEAETRLTRQVRKFQRNPEHLSVISLDLWWETLLHVLQKRGFVPAESLTFEEVLSALKVNESKLFSDLQEQLEPLVTLLERLKYSGESASKEDALAAARACAGVLSIIKVL